MRVKLYIGGLAPHTTERDLREMLGNFTQDVLGIFLLPDPKTGRHRGFGFLELATQAAADALTLALDGQMVHGRRLEVRGANRA